MKYLDFFTERIRKCSSPYPPDTIGTVFQRGINLIPIAMGMRPRIIFTTNAQIIGSATALAFEL
jgi:hypothetical protein